MSPDIKIKNNCTAVFYSEPNASKLPCQETQNDGSNSLKPTNSLPFLMEKQDRLMEDKPIIPPA